ncbi:MAG TPA: LptA/OstA family protein [Candidatus Limnocylindria bacterium]|nr:LptA/OstA family protein [Candidatus Limnocylindria bacterium]
MQWLVWLATPAVALCLVIFARAQTAMFKGGTDFRLPLEYHPASNGVVRLKTLLTGAKFQTVSNSISVITLTRPRIENYREDGTTLIWTAISPECIVNTATRQVSGPTNIFFRTADNRHYLTGVGFLWQQSNSVLILSNQTFTWIDRQDLSSSPGESKDGKMKLPLAWSLIATVKLTAAEIELPPAKPGLTIQSSNILFDLVSNSILYSNNVVVVDKPLGTNQPETIITCNWATAKRSAAGMEEIVAYEKVTIDQGDKHARGNHAIYTATNEQLVLTGSFSAENPLPHLYLSSSGVTQAAVRIIYDRKNNTIRGEGEAIMTVPASALKSGSTTNPNGARKIFP